MDKYTRDNVHGLEVTPAWCIDLKILLKNDIHGKTCCYEASCRDLSLNWRNITNADLYYLITVLVERSVMDVMA